MIYKLQKKFILLFTISVLAVILLVFSLIMAFTISSMNRNLDMLADRVSEGGGHFPGSFDEKPLPDKTPTQSTPHLEFITPETPFATRYFTVWFDISGNTVRVNTESIHSVTENYAIELATEAASKLSSRGWIYNYRYKLYSTEGGSAIVFIDGSMNRSQAMQSIMISATVLLGCAALVILLVVLLSKRLVKPIAESYEKQKQFITDANHELKTPLTLILANLDIAEAELGKNEWLNDIRSEGLRMTELVNQLVALSRMDEGTQSLNLSEIAFGEIVCDTVAEFKILSESREKALTSEIDTTVTYIGDEVLLRRLLSILLDNAVKYCDDGGKIFVKLERRRHVTLTVENTYSGVDSVKLDRLFDRFYRADKARKFTGGYGIGLSIAKAITEKHKGEITAYKKDAAHIGFKVVL